MKKRTLALACAAAVAAAGMLGGCSWKKHGNIIVNDPKKDNENDKEISFYGYQSDTLNLRVIEDVLHGFMNENKGINIIYESAKGTAYWEAFKRRYFSGNLDDIFMVDHDRIVGMFDRQNDLVDLSDVLDLSKFRPAVREQMQDADGAVYFVPLSVSTLNLYVNYDVLAAHGQKLPENFKEFSEVCDYFVKNTDVAPVIANNYTSLRTVMTARSMAEVYAGDARSAIKEFNQNPEALAAQYEAGVDLAADMVDKGWIDKEEALAATGTSLDPAGDLGLFVQNERPFMITGGWASTRVKDEAPGLNYGVYPLPVLGDGSVLVTEMTTCVSINADCAEREEAKDFISYMMQPNVLWDYNNSQSSYMSFDDNRVPDDKAIAPSAEFLAAGKNIVIGSDFRLTVPLNDTLTECGLMLLRGENRQAVKEYLLNQLKKAAGNEN